VIGGTAYAAFNLAAPENKLKPSEMNAMEEGIPPVVPNNQAWAADFAGKFGDLVKQEENIAIDAYKELAKEAGKENKKLTKEEEEALKKLHLEQVAYLKDQGDLEAQDLTELGKLQKKHREENTLWYNKKYATEEEWEKAIGQLKERQEEELNLLEYKQMSESLDLRMENNEKEAKDRIELLEAAEKVAEAAGEKYHERRLAWVEEMEKREEKAQKTQEEEDKEDWTKGAFWSEIGKSIAREIGKKIYEWAVSVVDLITTPLSAIGDMVGNLFGGFKTIGAAPVQKISEIFGSIMGGSGIDDVKAATEQAALFFEQLARKLPTALDWFAKTGVPRIIDSFVKNLPAVIQSLVKSIPVIIDNVIKNLDKIILPFVKGMLTLVPQLIKRIPDLIKELARLLPKLFAEIFASLPEIIGSAVGGIFESIGGLFTGFISGLSDIFSATSEEEKKTNQAKLGAYNTAKKMGYSEEDAAAAATAFANKQAGKNYDVSDYAKFAGDLAYKEAIDSGKSEEEAVKARIATYNDAMSVIPSRRTPGEVAPEELAAIVARAKAEAKAAYDKMYARAMDTAERSWVDERDRLKRRGLTDEQISEERKAFMAQARQNALDRAEEEYQKVYGQVYEMLLQDPNGANAIIGPSLIHGGGSETTPLPPGAQPSNGGSTVHKWHKGGVIDGATNLARAIRAHTGYAVPGGLASDDVPIIAQAGEAIMTREWTKNAGGKAGVEAQNRAGGPAGGVVNNVYVEHMMSGDTAQVVDSLISGNLRSGAGRLYDKFNSGRPAGYKTRRA